MEDYLMHEAENAGRLIAKGGAILLSGGLGGVMEAASRGARKDGGLTIGIMPHDHTREANEFVDVPIATGLGFGRNVVIANTADGFIAIGGEYGTLSEIAFALQLRKPVVGINTWDIKGVIPFQNAGEAVRKLFEMIG